MISFPNQLFSYASTGPAPLSRRRQITPLAKHSHPQPHRGQREGSDPGDFDSKRQTLVCGAQFTKARKDLCSVQKQVNARHTGARDQRVVPVFNGSLSVLAATFPGMPATGSKVRWFLLGLRPWGKMHFVPQTDLMIETAICPGGYHE
jgi:hypothetical protein